MSEQPADLPVLDPAVVGPLSAIGPGVLATIGATYLADAPQRVEALRAAARTGDVDAARHAAHALKGGSAGLGARRVQAAAERVEQAAREGRLPTPADLDELARLVEETAPGLSG